MKILCRLGADPWEVVRKHEQGTSTKVARATTNNSDSQRQRQPRKATIKDNKNQLDQQSKPAKFHLCFNQLKKY